MKTIRWKKLFIYGLVMLLILSSSGCFRSNDSPSPKPSQEKQKSKKLGELQTSIDELQKELESLYLKQVAPTPPSPSQEGEGQSQGGSQGQGEEQKSGESQEGGGGSSGSGKGEEKGSEGGGNEENSSSGGKAAQGEQAPDWGKLEQLVTKVHEDWNELLPELGKAGASRDRMESFSRGLDEVTMAITHQDIYQGLFFANEIYYESISFEKLFDSKAPPELKEVIYFLRKAAYEALHQEKEAAMLSITSAQERWIDVKPQLEPHQSQEQLEFSLRELEQAISLQDPNLIKIRRKIAEANVKEVMKRETEKGNQS